MLLNLYLEIFIRKMVIILINCLLLYCHLNWADRSKILMIILAAAEKGVKSKNKYFLRRTKDEGERATMRNFALGSNFVIILKGNTVHLT